VANMMLSCRKRGSRALVVAGTVILVLVAGAAGARAQAPKGRVSFSGLVGGCLPALNDVNRDIRRGNVVIESRNWVPIKEINTSYTFTGDLRARVYGPLTLSLGIGQSYAHTNIGDFDQVITVKPKVAFYLARILYDLPFKPMPRMTLRVGGGPVDATSAQVAVRHEKRIMQTLSWIESATFKAKGWGAHALLESELMLNQRTTLIIDVGYRRLNLNRSGGNDNFLGWSRNGVDNPLAYSSGNIYNMYTLADDASGGYLSESFLEVPLAGGHPIPTGKGGNRELVYVRDLRKIDFSGPQASVGLRFYLF
jgi:hypothetical protein